MTVRDPARSVGLRLGVLVLLAAAVLVCGATAPGVAQATAGDTPTGPAFEEVVPIDDGVPIDDVVPIDPFISDAALGLVFEDAANALAYDIPLSLLDHNADPAAWAGHFGVAQPSTVHRALLGWEYDFVAMLYPDAATASAAMHGMETYFLDRAAGNENSWPDTSWVFYRHYTLYTGFFHTYPSVFEDLVTRMAYDAYGNAMPFVYSPEEMAVLYPDDSLAYYGYHLMDVHHYTRAWTHDNLLIYLELPHVGDDEHVFNLLVLLGQTPMLHGTVRDGEGTPMKGVEVRLVAEKGGASHDLGLCHTDNRGHYALPFGSPPESSKVKLLVTLRHEWAFTVNSGDPGAPVVSAQVPVPDAHYTDGKDHELNVQFGQAPMTGLNGLNATQLKEASIIYRHTEEALSFAVNTLGVAKGAFTRKPLPVYVHATGDTAYYQPGPAGKSYILIPTADSGLNSGDRAMNREYHEFGHYLMDELYAGGIPATTGANHGGTDNPDSGDSIVEGFAEFFSLLVAGTAQYRWAGTRSNLEDNGITNGRTDEEFAVAGLYWDLYDKVEAKDGDYIHLGRSPTWKHATAGAVSVRALYTRLKTAKVGQTDTLKTDAVANDLDLLFIQHGFYQDKNKNGRWDTGEAAGWAGAVSGTERPDKPPRPGGSVVLNLVDASGAPLPSATVILSYHSPQGSGYYDFVQEIEVANGQEIYFDLPDLAGATATFKIKDAAAGADELVVDGAEYWLHVRQTAGGLAFGPVATGTLSTGPTGGGPSPFWDVPTDHQYFEAIKGMADAGIINGYTDGSFGSNDPVLRQQFAKMIVGTMGLPCSEANICYFADVAKGGPSTLYPDNYIAVAAAFNITKGTGGGNYSPYRNITRAQVITMVVRAAQQYTTGLQQPDAAYFVTGVLATFDDPTHGHNAQLAEFNGLLDGVQVSGNPIDWVWQPATRAEVAQILWNLANAG